MSINRVKYELGRRRISRLKEYCKSCTYIVQTLPQNDFSLHFSYMNFFLALRFICHLTTIIILEYFKIGNTLISVIYPCFSGIVSFQHIRKYNYILTVSN